jgi:hypothetical protein
MISLLITLVMLLSLSLGILARWYLVYIADLSPETTHRLRLFLDLEFYVIIILLTLIGLMQ